MDMNWCLKDINEVYRFWKFHTAPGELEIPSDDKDKDEFKSVKSNSQKP
jgi:hypothetical protein